LSQANPMVRSPDPFFRHHKEKRKKAVWPRETTFDPLRNVFQK